MAAKFRFPVRRSPKSDPQQFRVYRMENEAIGARSYAKLTPPDMAKLVRSVCRNYGVPMPKLIWANLGRWAAEWDNDRIRFSNRKKNARDILTVTHELAHHIHYWLSDGAEEHHEPHGPEFMACHISILDTCRVVPVVAMRAVCKAWKIRYEDPGTGSSLRTLKRIVTRGRNRPSA